MIHDIVPVGLMLMFMVLWQQSQRHLHKAWNREDELHRIIKDLTHKGRLS